MAYVFGSVGGLKNVGQKRLEMYGKLNIHTPYDLINHYPRTYIDFTEYRPIRSYPIGSKGVVRGAVVHKRVTVSGKYTIYKSVIEETYTRENFVVTIFNNRYADERLILGREYLFYGKIEVSFNQDTLEMGSPTVINAYNPIKMQSVYRLTAGLTNAMVQANLREALHLFDNEAFDIIDDTILQKLGLIPLQRAFHTVHFPTSHEDVTMARKRLAFNELLVLQIGMVQMKRFSRKYTSCTMGAVDTQEFLERLPFELTQGQRNAIEEITGDLQKSTPMNRLVQGDVGSGKTVVAMYACFYACRNGYQSAMVAPTEILAQQHYATFSKMLEPLGINVCLLTGSLTAKQKKAVRQQIADGEVDVVIGTHALFQKDTIYSKLGLVVVDEQHRFGVAQRSALAHKGNHPHRLVMSATPIPRTLGLLIYGDLDISIIKELPAGRKPVQTFAVTGKIRDRVYNYVIKCLERGEQAYMVCPSIEENELELQSVYEYYGNLSKGKFKDYRLGILHGKMSAEDKDRVMLDFKEGLIDLLISTTVIEVGIDVPNATIIVIENADRFGLSQLHQLRGRVGRGSIESSCILITDNTSEDSKNRLRVMCATSDGFQIAEKDLEIRGCGDFFGNRQHGLPTLKIADLVNDMSLVECARETACEILDRDPDLESEENSALKLAMIEMFENASD